MKNLTTAIFSKFAGSAFSTGLGARIYLDDALAGAAFPYCVYSIISVVPDRTFTEQYTNVLIQFSLFSASAGVGEITTLYADLKTLFDEKPLTITGSVLVWMKEENLTTMVDNILVKDATVRVKHWAVDYEILTSLN